MTLRVLVAMRCLDEGVDIPDARVAYLLASSSNPRQFIQRRGRILRPAPGKDMAEIIDYLAVPQAGTPLNFDVERNLLTRELERANEFGKLAENYEATLALLRPSEREIPADAPVGERIWHRQTKEPERRLPDAQNAMSCKN